MRIGFVINPIAGMGGRVGLKGSDGVVEGAVRRGAVPVANGRAGEMLLELFRLVAGTPQAQAIHWLTVAGQMGLDALRAAGFANIDVVHAPPGTPSADDTRIATRKFLAAGVDLVLFCGGDGTARDICAVVGQTVPVLGIPSGVKMYSGVFGVTPVRTAQILARYLAGQIGTADVEIVDLDEDKYRQDEWAVRLYMAARTPFEPTYTQASKALISGADEETVKEDIAAHLGEEIAAQPDTLYLLGPGSSVQAVGRALDVAKTLLGVEAFAGGKLVGRDLDERQILDLLPRYSAARLVLSPIGAQGFVLGRGNQQLSPAVIRRIGADNILIIASPAKLARTPVLRFDTGDPALDAALISRRYYSVIVGYHRFRMVGTAA